MVVVVVVVVVGGVGAGFWGLNSFFLALGPVSRKPRLLFRPEKQTCFMLF